MKARLTSERPSPSDSTARCRMWSMPISNSRSSRPDSTLRPTASSSSSQSRTVCPSTLSSSATSATTAATTSPGHGSSIPSLTETQIQRPSRRKSRPWNGRDFYCVLDRAENPGRWSIARKYGLLSAGGGSWYWKPLRHLTPGKRVFAYVGGAGYVGIGRVTGEMIPARHARVEINGDLKPLLDQPELSTDQWHHAASDDPERTEMVVPVEWLGTRTYRRGGLGEGPLRLTTLRMQSYATKTRSRPSSPHSDLTPQPTNRPSRKRALTGLVDWEWAWNKVGGAQRRPSGTDRYVP